MSFGSHDFVNLSEVREKRDTARKQVANGIDPLEERKAQKLAQQISIENSFEAICREWHATKLTTGQWPIAKKSLRHSRKMCSRSLVNALSVKSSS